ncbi:hypothetical protein THAOC_37704 [Thalassiosira oceanica]|uniref:Uncharacterized protein n=1 Tax=Thalassiosira oceanica TaxID=159749 RepID=K0QYI1_THAOC|nr:hypothetical protein THAOC_37704 [Thalassiosira oceanica]|eukprot:EJK43815.1 hypothetical protein THAOC_37704 [Thalassiosira oceanica]
MSCESQLEREAKRQRYRRGRSPTQISGQKEAMMVPDGHAALQQGLSSIPHLVTSVAAGFYGSAMGAVIGPPGEAMEELDSPYHRCCAVVPAKPMVCLVTAKYRPEDVAQGGK